MTQHQVYTLSNTTATRLTPNGTHSGMDITIQNLENIGYVYIGGEGVTTTSFGYRLAPGHAISFELPGLDALYAIAEVDQETIAVIKIGLEQQD